MIERARFFAATAVMAVTFSVVAAACGSDGPPLSEVGARGRSISINNGCAGCHGADGQGGSGPGWQGLAGSEIELLDGTVIIADDAYLTRAIADPAADLRAGFNLQMPTNRLTDDEIADIVAYINEISQPER